MLFIGEKEKAAIDAAIQAARAKPTPFDVMRQLIVDDRTEPTQTLKFDERGDPDRIAAIKEEYPSHHVQLGTYTAAISFEEQPAGLMRHISIAARDARKGLNEPVVGACAAPPATPCSSCSYPAPAHTFLAGFGSLPRAFGHDLLNAAGRRRRWREARLA